MFNSIFNSEKSNLKKQLEILQLKKQIELTKNDILNINNKNDIDKTIKNLENDYKIAVLQSQIIKMQDNKDNKKVIESERIHNKIYI